MPQRNMQAEQTALKQFGTELGRMPNSPSDWDILHRMAYSPQDMPDEFRQAYSTPNLGQNLPITTPSVSGLPQTPEASNIDQLRGNIETQRGRVQQLQQPSNAINVLQNAIKIATKPETRNIGESSIFKTTGVGGIGALSSSLSATGNALKYDATTKANIISNMAGMYSDLAKAATNNYELAVNEFRFESDRLQNIINEATKYDRELNLIKKNNDAAKELALYKSQLEGGNIDMETGEVIPQWNYGEIMAETGKLISPDGTERLGGSLSWRHNNPLNIKYANWEDKFGAVQGQKGTDGGYFAYFPDLESGYNAARELLKSDSYNNLDLNTALKKWSGGGYDLNKISATNGLPRWANKTTGQMTDQELGELMVLMETNGEGGVKSGKLGTTQMGDLGLLNQYQRNMTVGALTNQVYGSKASDADRELMEKTVDIGIKLSKNRYDMVYDALGFEITDNKELADTLTNILTVNADPEKGLKGFDMMGLAMLVNNDKLKDAVTKVELNVLPNAGENKFDGKNREAAAIYITNKGDELINNINNNLDNLGIVQGNWNKLKSKFQENKNFQQIEAQIGTLVYEWRKSMGGTAITDTEQLFLARIIPDTTDNPWNAIEKIKEFQKSNLEQYNSLRQTVNLPILNKDTLLNKSKRVGLYDGTVAEYQYSSSEIPQSDINLNDIDWGD